MVIADVLHNLYQKDSTCHAQQLTLHNCLAAQYRGLQILILFVLDVLELGEDSLSLVKALAAPDKSIFLEPAEHAKPAWTVTTCPLSCRAQVNARPAVVYWHSSNVGCSYGLCLGTKCHEPA